MKLTKAAVSKLRIPEGRSELLVFDDDMAGFGLRLRAGGSATWLIQYRIGKQQRRMTIGKYPAMAPEPARTAAAELLAKVRLGEDPQGAKLEARHAVPVKRLTVGDICDMYLDAAMKRQKSSTFKETRRHLSRDWTPLRTTPVIKAELEHVAAELRHIATRTGPVNANRARANLSACFSWAMGEGLAPRNPVIGTNKIAEEKPRDRVLGPEEIRAIWQATEAAGDFNVILRLLLLTGQRREEVASMAWSELNLDKAEWFLPRERTKNGRPHFVPLSSTAKRIITALPRRARRDLVFGQGCGGFSGWSQCKRRLDDRLSLPPWRLHDLRRTFVTGLYELNVQPHVVEAMVNHISGHRAGVSGVYNKAEYLPEKRQATAIWAEHIASIIADEPNNVIPIRRSDSE
ncbi:MAG: integrase arm-type DNA-binding domain-containing protein [Pseudomonadota bacterium]